jgi:MFS transporter, PAT family, beta-lactamase induction signal transducer AmpG
MAANFSRFFSKRMIVNLIFGLCSGLPLLLTGSTLQAWMTEQGVDLKTIGLMSLVGIPYSFKFVWAPLFDRFTLPLLGRRRGWLLFIQLFLALSIIALGLSDWNQYPLTLALVCLLVTFFSASQDIVIDAYRRESLLESELGFGASLAVLGYRLGMIISGALALALADFISWQYVYFLMGGIAFLGVFATLFADEPKLTEILPRNFQESVIGPFVDYFQRPGSVLILLFLLLYKLGDNLAGQMTMPFYLQLGFQKIEIATIVKLYGLWALILGGLVGGAMMVRLKLLHSLLIFGFLQAASTFGFAILSHMGPSSLGLTAVITFENLTAGMGASAQVALMAQLTNKRFSATQFALLSSLVGVPRIFLSAPAGYLAESFGWFNFFTFSTLIALPGMLLVFKLQHYATFTPTEKDLQGAEDLNL